MAGLVIISSHHFAGGHKTSISKSDYDPRSRSDVFGFKANGRIKFRSCLRGKEREATDRPSICLPLSSPIHLSRVLIDTHVASQMLSFFFSLRPALRSPPARARVLSISQRFMKETAASPPLPPFLCGPAAVLLASLLSQVKVGKARRRPPPFACRCSLRWMF